MAGGDRATTAGEVRESVSAMRAAVSRVSAKVRAAEGSGEFVSAECAMQQHFQRRLLGFVLQPLHEIQDFIKLACGADEKGCVSGEKKQWVADLMAECAPLASLYGRICGHTALGKMLKFSTAVPKPDSLAGAPVVLGPLMVREV